MKSRWPVGHFAMLWIALGTSPLAWSRTAPVLEAPRAPVVARDGFAWHEFRPGDVREIPDAYVETELRLELIRRARHTIDVSQYLQTADGAVAMPVMSALHDAANRGVQVRFLTTGTVSLALDVLRKFRHRLLAVPTVTPIQCLYFDGKSPWSDFDALHEKWIIVDGQWVITGGRAYGEQYLHWLDDGFIARGALATDAQEIFSRTWSFVTTQQAPRRNATFTPVTEAQAPPFFRHWYVTPMTALSAVQHADLQTYLAWLDTGADLSQPATGRARALHFDFFQQRWMNHFPRSYAARTAQLQDPIISALSERIARPETRRVLISSMALIEHPVLKAALTDAARRGAEVRLFTNSRETDDALAPLSVNWIYSLYDMRDLLAAGARIEVFTENARAYPWVYLHKKMAIVDDDVFVGSHNFHYPSSLYNDEADFEIEDADFARTARERLEAQIALTGRPLTAAEVDREFYRGPFFVRGIERWLSRTLLPLY